MFGLYTRRILVVLPVALALVLLQSALWVPRYDAQARGNESRLTTFIEASIGDAKILNPFLSADAASSDVHRRIFEGLIDADENLELKPLLAERWETTEDAYLAVIPGRKLPDGRPASGAVLLEALRAALDTGRLGDVASAVQGLELVPETRRSGVESVVRAAKEGKPQPYDIKYEVRVPERVKIRLSRVVPELFEKLEPVVGKAYFEGYPFESRFTLARAEDMKELRPKLPEILPVAEHNPTITFYLRRGVRFHDGHPFTARDVKFTYEAIVDPRNASPRASSFEPIRSVDVIDDYTVRVVYERLHSAAIVDWAMGIVPEHRLNEAALEREMDRRNLTPEARKTFTLRSSDFNENPIGTGPFRFVEWKKDQYVRLTRNDQYWDKKPEYKDLYIRVIPDYVAQEIELQAGAIDAYGVLPHQAARFRKDPDFQVLSSPAGSYAYIGYNLRRPLFQDVRVRKALGMAINVDEVIRYVLYGEGRRTSGPYYANTPYYNPNTPLLPYDPKGALELLAQAGWKKNADGWLEKNGKVFEFTLITNHANPQRAAIMTVAQAAWRRLGIRCETRTFEWTVYLKGLESHDFDAFILGWTGGGLDPDLFQIWHSSQTGEFQLNKVGYSNPEADDLIMRIRREYDREKQTELAWRLHDLIASDHPYTFLYSPMSTYALDNKIVMVERKPDRSEVFRKVVPAPSGEITYYFNQWRKLPTVPHFAAEN